VKSLVGGGGGGFEAPQMDQYKTQQKQQKKPKHPPLIITRKVRGGGTDEYNSQIYDYRTTVKSLEEMEELCSKVFGKINLMKNVLKFYKFSLELLHSPWQKTKTHNF
jgi:hypothetical protein